ncbi:hypothetical protein [Burkholderia multivorans]|nr:hypothetical protein [Burkholderia multivorans]
MTAAIRAAVADKKLYERAVLHVDAEIQVKNRAIGKFSTLIEGFG